MTNQDLFTRITENFQAYDQLQATIDQDTTSYTGGLHWASGDLLTERRELISWYANSNIVIFRCSTEDCNNRPFWTTVKDLKDEASFILTSCQICFGPADRLLSDGTWQTQAERDELNQVAYQRRVG